MTYSSSPTIEIYSQEKVQEIQAFHGRFGEAHLYLAYHAAFPVALTPQLLYRVWANFQKDIQGQDLGIPWIAVADLLLSSFCREVGHELYEMEWETRKLLLDQLINHPRFSQKRIEQLANFLLACVQRQLNSPKNSVRTLALAQRWTALAYTDPEAVAHDFALQLRKLSLEEKTEWVRMSKLAETIAVPLREAQFEPLLIYLQGMRDLARSNPEAAKSQFQALPSTNNRMVVAGVTLSIPELKESAWNISTTQLTPPPLQVLRFEVAEFSKKPRFMTFGSKWIVNTHHHQAEFFVETLVGDLKLEMVRIPGGEFLMGSSEKEGGYREKPQHLVTVAPFFLSRFPITQAQWEVVAQKDKVRIDLRLAPSRFIGPNLPVEHITWFEAIEFCERLQLQTGKLYRLSSEAEWEYACRAGTDTPFHFGETISPKLATYDGSQKYLSGPKGKSSKQTTEVGFYQVANRFGLEDLHGQVWEWCADHWYDDYINAPADGTARITNHRASSRLIRGGSWADPPGVCRSGYRNAVPPGNKILTIGFRIALSL